MSQSELILSLQNEAKINPAVQAIFLMLSSRKRHRSILNLVPLDRQMKKEGFKYSKADYSNVLLWLEKMNIGRIIRTKRGKVKGLVDIKYKLDSIGSSGLGGTALESCKLKSKPALLTDKPRPILTPMQSKSLNKVLQIAIRELPITITMPDSMNLKTLIGSLNELIS